ncbi:MAG: hypothetical protein HOQ04_07365 [Pseudarthrobacter sp.]|nr:hypothetical protein [Pseudarthrobacter sp.]
MGPLEAARFPPVAPLITMKSIEVFGRPAEDLLAQLRAKARLLAWASPSRSAGPAGVTGPAM